MNRKMFLLAEFSINLTLPYFFKAKLTIIPHVHLSAYQSVCLNHYEKKSNFSAFIQDRYHAFFMKIHITNEHLFYDYFFPSVCRNNFSTYGRTHPCWVDIYKTAAFPCFIIFCSKIIDIFFCNTYFQRFP